MACALVCGCGSKGPPLPPLARVPDVVSQISARRIDDEVFVSLVIPAKNVDQSPGTVTHIDLFALTADNTPQADALMKDATRIASVIVAPPMPDAAGPARTASSPPIAGQTITLRDALDAAALVVHPVIPAPKAVALPGSAGRGAGGGSGGPAGPASVAPAAGGVPPAGGSGSPGGGNPSGEPGAAIPGGARAGGPPTSPGQTTDAPAVTTPREPEGPRRYYMAVAFGAGDRSARRGSLASVPIVPAPPAPEAPMLTGTAEALEASWPESTNVAGYNIYRDDPAATPAPRPPDWAPAVPTPLNGTLLLSPAYSEPVEFGRERCFRVRAVQQVAGTVVEGVASEPRCLVARDTFPPAAPSDVTALATADGITLKWSPNTEKDLAGYVVLRGRAGDATLLPITPTPVPQTLFIDRDVMPGGRYVYAVRAVDSAEPEPNVSADSAHEDITAP